MTRRRILDWLGIITGATLTAIGLDLFLIPNKIAAGGVSGIATVLYYVLHIPVGISMLAINVPLFIFSTKELGATFGIRTLGGAVVLSVAVDFFAPRLPVFTADLLLAAVFGGVIVGIGMGIVFRSHGTTAGTDLAAKLINKFTGLSVGKALLTVDFCVITAAGIAFQSAGLAMYALISLYITSRVIDLIQEGEDYDKMVFIISAQAEKIATQIMREMDRGATAFTGRGMYTQTERQIVMCVVSRTELAQVKDIIHAIDPASFVVVTHATEVIGEGFNLFSQRRK